MSKPDQRDQASERLESLGELTVGVAHDFNNLLGVILNYTTLLARRVTDTTDATDLGEIRAAAEEAAGLTRQLLAFARRDIADPEPLDVNEIVRGVASMLDRTLGPGGANAPALDDADASPTTTYAHLQRRSALAFDE